ncbi:MAG: YfhO family protein [Armatimonadota bacterium]|nr:YfhO family protein [Armatimonadota bacterium]MCX7778066.1 YfhO family protein [Armatimonadota bacterium]MDW8025745.1 YfhO family protein [Armatimonadota bacterium]
MTKSNFAIRIAKAVAPIMVLTLLATFLLRRQIIFGEALWYGDILTFFYPVRSYVAERLLNLQVPLWQPYSNMGIAALAEPQYQVFYPPLWLTLPLPTHYGISLVLWLHILLAGCILYVFLRTCLRLKETAALFGAIAYMLSGFIQGHMAHLIHVLAYPYLPLLLLIVHKALTMFASGELGLSVNERRSRKIIWAIACGVVISLQVLTGSQFAYYSIIAAIAFSVFIAIDVKVSWHRCILFWLPAIAVGLGISALQTMPSMEVAMFSARTASFKFASDGSLPPLYWLISSTLPNYYGTFLTGFTLTGVISPEEAFAFVGHSTILLSLICVMAFLKRNRFAIFFAAMALASLILSFGIYNPLWKLLSPIASFMFRLRCPSRWLIIYTLGISVLSSIGLHSLLEGLGNLGSGSASGRKLALFRLLFIFVTLYAACLTAVLLLHWRRGQDEFSLLLDLLLLALLWWYALLIMRWAMRGFSKFDALLLTLGLTCELFLLSLGMHFSVGVKHELIERPASAAKFVGEHERYFSERFAVAPAVLANGYLRAEKFSNFQDAITRAQIELLKPSLNLLALRRAVDTEGELLSRPLWALSFVRFRDLWHSNNEHLYRLAGVRCIISVWQRKGLKLRGKTKDGIFVYEDAKALPLLYPVEHAHIMRSTKEAIKLITRPHFNPRAEVALLPMGSIKNITVGEDSAQAPASHAASSNKFNVRKWEYEVCEVECDAKRACWLIWLECFHPGWKAFIDGMPTTVHCANGAFMSVRVEPGRHKIIFAFLPTSYLVGAFITLCTVSAIFAIMVCYAVQRIGKKP